MAHASVSFIFAHDVLPTSIAMNDLNKNSCETVEIFLQLFYICPGYV